MKSFLAYAISSTAALVVFGLPANANKYPDHIHVGGHPKCAGAGTSFEGLNVFTCGNGARYKWCSDGKQLFKTKDHGDEFCK